MVARIIELTVKREQSEHISYAFDAHVFGIKAIFFQRLIHPYSIVYSFIVKLEHFAEGKWNKKENNPF